MKTMSILPIWLRIRRTAARMLVDRSGIAATEFAVIVPVMLVMFFGTVEFSSGVAVDRKVTLMARTLSDLTSQSTAVSDTDLAGFFAASRGIMTPYSSTPTQSTVSELYVTPGTLVVKVQWSKGAPRATEHDHDTDRAQGRRHLSDFQRSQLSLCTGGRQGHGGGRGKSDRRRLYPSAAVDLRILSAARFRYDPHRPTS